MIRTAREEDRPAVAAIWEAAFGDPAEYVRFFLHRCFRPQRCLLSLDSTGRPVAAVHLLPAEYVGTGSGSFPVQYLYAAATLPEFRRQGRMAGLLHRADATGAAAGCRFTFLLPAAPELYAFYEANGYSRGLYARRITLTRRQLEAAAGNLLPEGSAPIDLDEMLRMRRKRFRPAILWGSEMLAYVVDEWKFSGGDLLTFGKGYGLCRQIADRVRVQELCVGKESWPLAAALLLRRYACERFEFQLPPDSGFFPDSGGETVPYGMLRFCSDEKKACDLSHAYVNLLLE